MDFSVIICTRNRAGFLQNCLASVLQQSGNPGPFEVVVVANACSDDTTAVANRFARADNVRVRTVEEPVPGLSRARNRGAAVAEGRWLVYLDDDAEAVPGWLAGYAALLSNRPQVETAGGPIQPDWKGIPVPPYWAEEFNCHVGHLRLPEGQTEFGPGTFPFGGNMLISREAFDRVGAFDPSFGLQGNRQVMGEEGEWFLRYGRKGGRPGYAPAAVIRHWVNPARITRRSLLQRSWHSGVASARSNATPPQSGELARWLRHAASAAIKGRLDMREAAYLAGWLGRIQGARSHPAGKPG